METKANTLKIVMTAMMMCLIMLAIIILRIPIPFTQGYVHLGDAMIFLAVLVLGWKYGIAAAALGSMLGDLIGGFPVWALWSIGIKGIMALLLGLAMEMAAKRAADNFRKFMVFEIVGMVVAGCFMTVGYYIAEGIMYGNWVIAALGIPWNIAQFVVGMVIAVAIATALCNTPAKNYFTYRPPQRNKT